MPVVEVSYPLPSVALLEINNPPMNALSILCAQQMVNALDAFLADPKIRCIVITGRDRAFSAGGDLKEVDSYGATRSGNGNEIVGRLLDTVSNCPKPVIAAVNGHCVGGGFDLALCCDIRVAGHDARFIAAGVNLGLVASAARLPRLIGAARAAWMVMTAQAIDGETAQQWGLATALWPSDRMLRESLNIAADIAAKPSAAIRAAKHMLRLTWDMPLEEAVGTERRLYQQLSRTPDHHEAVAAFREKRSPRFGD